jgi:hypothetical protein
MPRAGEEPRALREHRRRDTVSFMSPGTRSFLPVALALVGTTGCPSRAPAERFWTPCSCEYVTDFDQPGHLAVEICSETRMVEEAALSCARNLGVGAVTSCSCPTSSQAKCESKDGCRTVPPEGPH